MDRKYRHPSKITSLYGGNADADAAFESIRRKLRASHVKLDTIIQKCEEIDRNNDGLVHMEDFLDIVNDCLPINSLSKRERRYLTNALSTRESGVSLVYKKLEDILKEPIKQPDINDDEKEDRERWEDEDDTRMRYEPKQMFPPGTIGEWLDRAACPAEQRNYVKFVKSLERFERETGMKIVPHVDGFLVPLGPDLRASIQLYLP